MQGKQHPENFQLNSGYQIPSIGMGTFDKDGNYDNLSSVLRTALQLGYKHIDTAIMYGNSFDLQLPEDIEIKRENLFITTKYWNNMDSLPLDAIQNELMMMNLPYFDLVLIHQPIGMVSQGKVQQRKLEDVWRSLEECVDKGLVKSIGVSNFNVQLLLDLMTYAKIKPSCNQIEMHPYLTQNNMLRFCKENSIQVVAFSPLNQMDGIMQEPSLQEISKKYNKTIPQIVLNWHLCRGVIPIPKSFNEDRLKENLAIRDFVLEGEDIEKINQLDKKKRFHEPANDEMFNNIPFFD